MQLHWARVDANAPGNCPSSRGSSPSLGKPRGVLLPSQVRFVPRCPCYFQRLDPAHCRSPQKTVSRAICGPSKRRTALLSDRRAEQRRRLGLSYATHGPGSEVRRKTRAAKQQTVRVYNRTSAEARGVEQQENDVNRWNARSAHSWNATRTSRRTCKSTARRNCAAASRVRFIFNKHTP